MILSDTHRRTRPAPSSVERSATQAMPVSGLQMGASASALSSGTMTIVGVHASAGLETRAESAVGQDPSAIASDVAEAIFPSWDITSWTSAATPPPPSDQARERAVGGNRRE